MVFLLSPGLGVGQEVTGYASSSEYILLILQSSAMANSSSVQNLQKAGIEGISVQFSCSVVSDSL